MPFPTLLPIYFIVIKHGYWPGIADSVSFPIHYMASFSRSVDSD